MSDGRRRPRIRPRIKSKIRSGRRRAHTVIESSSEAIQLLVLGVCFTLALIRALRVRKAAWIEVACFFACMFLGNAYWYGYLSVFGRTPDVSYISDLNWIAGYAFLLMLLIECNQKRGPTPPVLAAWIPVAVCAACCIYYICVNGYILLNLSEGGLMAALGFFAVRGVFACRNESPKEGFSRNRPLHVSMLVFVVVEEALWLSSLLDPTTDFVIYGIANYLLTFSYVAILAASWRSDDL